MRINQLDLLRLFNVDNRGNVALMFGLASLVVCGAVAGAIDYGRATHTKRQMQAATDAAAIAAATASSATVAERTAMAQSFFNRNNSNSFGENANLSVNIDSAAGTVSVTVNSNVPTTFMRVFGVSGIPISTASMVGASSSTSGKKLEVAMMVDLTGSMGGTRNGVTKIEALKLASADLINIFFPNNAQTSNTTRLAIAPMADYVNAGPYAPAVTGLDSVGPYNNFMNLKSTKNGPFSGSYAGSVTGGASGSQSGATSPSSSMAGATFSNGHCANPGGPGTPVAQAMYEDKDKPVGVRVMGTGTAPTQLMAANSEYYSVNALDNSSSGFDWEYFSSSAVDGVMGQGGSDPQKNSGSGEYYIPIPASVTGVTYMTDPGTGKLIGMPAFVATGSSSFQPQIKSASAAGGYVKITGFSNGSFTLDSVSTSTGYFIPVPTSMTSGGTIPECTSQNNPNDGYLVSCVTERIGSMYRSGDEFPNSGSFLGPYNQTMSGSTNKINYSEDGKCMTAGRELPAVIPLTNQRATLEEFFTNATIGGSTPGHLGHAWAWYMLSPKWNSIWPSQSSAAEYNDTTVMKAAIIMTDGEYNTQYTNETSKAQALALCQGMRAAGIKVFTIGFGFTTSAADTAAADTLKQCVNNEAGSYFLAYDGDALRQAFKDIGQQLTSSQSKLVFKK